MACGYLEEDHFMYHTCNQMILLHNICWNFTLLGFDYKNTPISTDISCNLEKSVGMSWGNEIHWNYWRVNHVDHLVNTAGSSMRSTGIIEESAVLTKWLTLLTLQWFQWISFPQLSTDTVLQIKANVSGNRSILGGDCSLLVLTCIT